MGIQTKERAKQLPVNVVSAKGRKEAKSKLLKPKQATTKLNFKIKTSKTVAKSSNDHHSSKTVP